MNIYTSEKALPYVYRLDNPTTGEIYIGFRKANILPSHLDLPGYRTSSKTVKPRFAEFNRTIVAEFFRPEDAYDHEQLSIFEEWGNPLLLNKQHGYGKMTWKQGKRSDENNDIVSEKMKGKFTFYYPDGVTKYGYISTSDPAIQDLGLIVPYTENKQKQNVARAKLAGEANTGTHFYNNGTEMKKFKQDPGGEWKIGQLPRDRSAQTAASTKQRKDTVIYNDGITNFYVPKGDEPNPSWKKGMKPRASKSLINIGYQPKDIL